MVAVPYGNLFLKAQGAGTEVDPAIVTISLRVRRETGYGEIGSRFPLPVYRSTLTCLPFATGQGTRQVLPLPPPGRRYAIDSLFLSSSSGSGTIEFRAEDGDNVQPLGAYLVSPRVMAQSISIPSLLLPDADVWAYPSDSAIVYGGFFLGRII